MRCYLVKNYSICVIVLTLFTTHENIIHSTKTDYCRPITLILETTMPVNYTIEVYS